MKLFKFLFTISIGAIYGLLFAPKSGKDFRKQLKKAENPAKDLFVELKNMDLEAYTELKKWADTSPEFQDFLSSSKDQLNALAQKAKELGDDASVTVEKELKNLAKNAESAAKKLQKKAVKKAKTTKKKVVKKAAKTVKTVKKSVAKKKAPAKKTKK